MSSLEENQSHSVDHSESITSELKVQEENKNHENEPSFESSNVETPLDEENAEEPSTKPSNEAPKDLNGSFGDLKPIETDADMPNNQNEGKEILENDKKGEKPEEIVDVEENGEAKEEERSKKIEKQCENKNDLGEGKDVNEKDKEVADKKIEENGMPEIKETGTEKVKNKEESLHPKENEDSGENSEPEHSIEESSSAQSESDEKELSKSEELDEKSDRQIQIESPQFEKESKKDLKNTQEKELLQLQKEIDDLQKSLSASEKRKNALEVENKSLKSENESLKRDLIEAQVLNDLQNPKPSSQYNSLTSENDPLNEMKSIIERLEKEKEELNRSLQMRTEGNKKLFKKISELEERLDDKEVYMRAKEILGSDYPKPEEISIASLFNGLSKKLQEAGFKAQPSGREGFRKSISIEVEPKQMSAYRDKIKMEEDLHKRLERLTNGPVDPSETTVISLVNKLEGIIRLKDDEVFDLHNEVDRLKDEVKNLQGKVSTNIVDKKKFMKRKSKMKDLKDELETLKFKYVNEENEKVAPLIEIKTAFISIVSECRQIMAAEDFKDLLSRMKVISRDLVPFIKVELATCGKLEIIKPYLDKLLITNGRGSYTNFMAKRTALSKNKEHSPISPQAKLPLSKRSNESSEKKEDILNKSNSSYKESERTQRGLSPLRKREKSSSAKQLEGVGSAGINEPETKPMQRKKIQDDLLMRKVSELESENKKMKASENNWKRKLQEAKKEAQEAQNKSTDFQETVKGYKPISVNEVPAEYETIKRVSPPSAKEKSEVIAAIETSSFVEKKTLPRKSPKEEKNMTDSRQSRNDDFSFSGIGSSRESSFSFEDSRQTRTKSFIADKEPGVTLSGQKMPSKSPSYKKKNIVLDNLTLVDLDLTSNNPVASGRSSKGTGVFKPNFEAVGRIKGLFQMSSQKSMGNSILFVKEPAPSQWDTVPRTPAFNQEHSPRFKEKSASPPQNTAPQSTKASQRAGVYSFNERGLVLSEDPTDESPAEIPFEKVFFSHKREEAYLHFRHLIERNQHNYLTIYGGSNCGVKAVQNEIVDALVEFLIQAKRWIENQKINVTFINSSLKKESLHGSFAGRNPIRKNDIVLKLAQLEIQPNLISSAFLSENKRIGQKPTNQNPAFLQISFKFEKELEPRSFTLLLLRKIKMGLVDDSSVTPGIHRIVNRSLLELRPMALSYYKNQKEIEHVVKKYLDLSRVSMVFCICSKNQKIQETLHTLSIYNALGAEKRGGAPTDSFSKEEQERKREEPKPYLKRNVSGSRPNPRENPRARSPKSSLSKNLRAERAKDSLSPALVSPKREYSSERLNVSNLSGVEEGFEWKQAKNKEETIEPTRNKITYAKMASQKTLRGQFNTTPLRSATKKRNF